MKLIPERNLDKLEKKYNKTVERLLERERKNAGKDSKSL
jgi:hypothetical protein